MTEPLHLAEVDTTTAAVLPPDDPNLAGDDPVDPEQPLGDFLPPDDVPTLLATAAAEVDNDLDGDGVPDPTGGA